MRHLWTAGVAALAGALGGCDSGATADNKADNATAVASADAGAPSFCEFAEGDTREWKASIAKSGADGASPPLVVTGWARLWDREAAPQLGGPDSKPPTLRLWLTKGKASDLGYEDGFREVRFELPDPGGIETVVIRCDRTTDVATIKVERAG